MGTPGMLLRPGSGAREMPLRGKRLAGKNEFLSLEQL